MTVLMVRSLSPSNDVILWAQALVVAQCNGPIPYKITDQALGEWPI